MTEEVTAVPKDRLSDAIIKILRQFGLRQDGYIRVRDLIKAGIFREDDYHQRERLEALGFPPGMWLSANVKIWTPEVVGTFLLNLPTEKPVLSKEVRRLPRRPPKVQHTKPQHRHQAHRGR
jgi:hypothetical protein